MCTITKHLSMLHQDRRQNRAIRRISD